MSFIVFLCSFIYCVALDMMSRYLRAWRRYYPPTFKSKRKTDQGFRYMQVRVRYGFQEYYTESVWWKRALDWDRQETSVLICCDQNFR